MYNILHCMYLPISKQLVFESDIGLNTYKNATTNFSKRVMSNGDFFCICSFLSHTYIAQQPLRTVEHIRKVVEI